MFNYRINQVLNNELQSTEAYKAYKNDRKQDRLSITEMHYLDRESNFMPSSFNDDDDE